MTQLPAPVQAANGPSHFTFRLKRDAIASMTIRG